MQIFHIATASDWEAAQQTGEYTTSTRGRTLAEEGFIHASRGDQWLAVRKRFYADVEEPLLLLAIESSLLTAPVVEESVSDSEETFPHVYGPINVDAVVTVLPLDRPGEVEMARPANPIYVPDPGSSLRALLFGEMFRRLLLATIVVACVAVGALARVVHRRRQI